jgi:hypothetical protein
MIRRPPLELVKARQWEIKRRYERKSAVGKRSRPMAAIRIAELKRWLGDIAGNGVELDASKWSEDVARIFVHHFVVLADGNRRAADWLATYCPWIETRDREYMITEANHCPLKWSADKLAWKIRLSDAKRTELRITTIGAFDVPKDERTKRRKAKQAELQKALRARRKAERQHHIG